MIKLDKDLRVSFAYMMQHLASNGKVPLTLVRGGKTLQVQLPVSAEHRTLVTDLQRRAIRPTSSTVPWCFRRLPGNSCPTSKTMPDCCRLLGAVKSPLITRALDPPDADTEELVVVSSPFFPHKLANGYSNPAGSVVYSVNGTHIRSLKHLVALLRDLKDPFVTIEFDQKGNEALVFSRAAMLAATDDILTDNGVRAQGSPDMLEVWQGKTGK